MEPMTEREKELTVKNIVSACKDINKLNKRGYNFLYLASGFIGHYNIHGFRDYYGYHNLGYDILKYFYSNQWDNFRPGERDYDYYMAKKDVYNRVCEKLNEMPSYREMAKQQKGEE